MNDIKLTAINKPKPKVNKNMIQPFFIAGFCGTRGSGKTYTAVKLIIELINEGSLKGQDIYIISPTFYSNNIFHNIPGIKRKNILTDLNLTNEFMTRIKKEFEFIIKVWKTTRKKYTREQYYNWYRSILNKIDDEDSDESDPRDYDKLTNVEYLHLKLNEISQEPYFYNKFKFFFYSCHKFIS